MQLVAGPRKTSSTESPSMSRRAFDVQTPIACDTRNQLDLEKFILSGDSYGVVGTCGVMRA